MERLVLDGSQSRTCLEALIWYAADITLKYDDLTRRHKELQGLARHRGEALNRLRDSLGPDDANLADYYGCATPDDL